jgi:hypothetical protein
MFGIAESETKTDIVSTTIRAPITADSGSVAGKQVSIGPTLGDKATQINIAKGAKLTINQNSDPDLLQNLLDQQSSFVSQSDERLDTLLNSVGSLAMSSQTGGESERDKTILYVVIALAALFFFRR